MRIQYLKTWIAIAAWLAAYALFVAAATAETITLSAGEIGRQDFAAGNTYIGHASGTTVKTAASNPSRANGSAIVVRGIKFVGDGVRRDGNLTGLTVEDCTFDGCRVGVEVNGGSTVTVRNNTFARNGNTSWFANVSNVLWENNDIGPDIGYGIKVFGDSANNRNWTIRRNHFFDNGPDRMAIELQGACQDWLIEENIVERWRYGPNKADNDHTLLISAPMAKAAGPGIVRRNAVLGKKPRSSTGDGPWQDGAPAALEIGGTNTLVEQNLFSGAGVGITCTDKDGPASVTLKNNQVTDVFTIWNKDAASQTITTAGFNGAGTLDWTIDQLRAVAGRNPSVTIPPDPPSGDLEARVKALETDVQKMNERMNRHLQP